MRYSWWSKYSTNDHLNQTAAYLVDEAWDEINPGHGVVALDHNLAAAQGLPTSMSLPSDSFKGVYILDAYHQIHCLVSQPKVRSDQWCSLSDWNVDNYPQNLVPNGKTAASDLAIGTYYTLFRRTAPIHNVHSRRHLAIHNGPEQDGRWPISPV